MTKLRTDKSYFCHHKPTGEEWLLIGQSKDGEKVCAAGYPPSIANIEDCVNIKEHKFLTDEELKHRNTAFGESFNVPVQWHDNKEYMLYPFQVCLRENATSEVHNLGPDDKTLEHGDLVGVSITKTKAIHLASLTDEQWDQLGFEHQFNNGVNEYHHIELEASGYFTYYEESLKDFFTERISKHKDYSSAGIRLKYLHELNFVFRLITDTELGFDKFKL
ncbi:MAG: hypothetical protein AB8G11_07870 [Saprospiraceae bacterium]